MYLFNPSTFLCPHCHDPRSNARTTAIACSLAFPTYSAPSLGLQSRSAARHSSSYSKLTCQLPLLLKTFLVFSNAVRRKAKVITMPSKVLEDLAPGLPVPIALCTLFSFVSLSPLNKFVLSHLFTLMAASIWKALQFTTPSPSF